NMASPVDPLCNSWQHLYQQTCSETDQKKLPALLSRLEDAILLRQTELVTSSDHYDERIAMKLASKTLLRIKTYELNIPVPVEADPSGR
ncbi:MAG: hypothetical protein WB985_18165, partial [Candidatus Acidiferrales bacterium]